MTQIGKGGVGNFERTARADSDASQLGAGQKIYAKRVMVVDDEAAMRAAIWRVLTSGGFSVESYESGLHLLQTADFSTPACILLDLRMPGMDGLSVQRSLHEREVSLPVLFLTGAAEVRHAVTAMRSGAADFIEKPFDNDDLLRRVELAFNQHLLTIKAQQEEHDISERLKLLTPRETEVLAKIASGLTNKEVARELGTSHRTVEIQRAHILERMQADSLADLVRMYLLASSPGLA